MYLHFDEEEYPIDLSLWMQTNGIEPDKWKIKISQIDCKNELDIKGSSYSNRIISKNLIFYVLEDWSVNQLVQIQ